MDVSLGFLAWGVNIITLYYIPIVVRHGSHSCCTTVVEPFTTFLTEDDFRVVSGENPAAMQHGHGRSLNMLSCPSIWILIPSLVMFVNFNTNWEHSVVGVRLVSARETENATIILIIPNTDYTNEKKNEPCKYVFDYG